MCTVFVSIVSFLYHPQTVFGGVYILQICHVFSLSSTVISININLSVNSEGNVHFAMVICHCKQCS